MLEALNYVVGMVQHFGLHVQKSSLSKPAAGVAHYAAAMSDCH